jgi:GT2 family glycosyltransferase
MKVLPKISISVVSHAQIHLISYLLADLARYCQSSSIELILTLNAPENLPFALNEFPFLITIIQNPVPQGFAANHNQAFTQATGQFFCVLNPDVRLTNNPFPALLSCLKNNIGVAAPLVLNELGSIEDSARYFPTPLKILCKAFGYCKGSDYLINDAIIFPDWVAGMFMLFPSETFRKIGGFDTGFFLYYEDVNLCARLRLQGYQVLLHPQVKIIHQAHRTSHHNLTYLKWHLTSMLRFFCSTVFVQILGQKLIKK